MSNSQIEKVRINGDRLWESLMQMAQIGATAKGGCNRQALTDEDKQDRDLFVKWSSDAGCTINVDQMGNIFARRIGNNNDLPAVIAGSHLDTQPTGGKFDGAYGVLSVLEVIRSLNEAGVETEAPIEAVCWTNEESARFSPFQTKFLSNNFICSVFLLLVIDDQSRFYESKNVMLSF